MLWSESVSGDDRDEDRSSLSAPADSDAEDSVLRLVAAPPLNGDGPGVPHPREVIDGKYRVLRLIGRGGMGWVYEALHLPTGKTVALKFLRPGLASSGDWIERFAREARTAGKIDHPNVIHIYDVGGEGPGTYIVMEYLRGETLRDRLRSGPMCHQDAISMLLSVMRGVAEAHRLGVIHRDLKPDNIFLCTLPNGQPDVPKVLDFGVSKLLEHPSEMRTDRTPLGYVGGTPLYMALEQLQGRTVDARGDVYALGVVLFETLTCDFPFPARNREDLVVALATRSPARLPASAHPCAEQLNEILERALARDPPNRYSSVAELAQALASVPVLAEPAVQPRARWRALLAAGLVLSPLLLPLLWSGPSDAPQPTAAPRRNAVTLPPSLPQATASAPVPELTVPSPPPYDRRLLPGAKRRASNVPPTETKDDPTARAFELRVDDF
jgi:eukaryotic-like serine/threonine-protein kinase